MTPKLFYRLSLATVFGSLCLTAPVCGQTASGSAVPAATRKTAGPDWANLGRYHDANLELGPPARGENRVVFLGASIMEHWGNPKEAFFPGKPYVNRGISGQTTSQALVRFRQDVIDLKPKVVMINVGVNDIAGNEGPVTLEVLKNNYMSMADLARANGIRVVLSTLTPARQIPWRKEVDAGPAIHAINAWMKSYAARSHIVYLDYFSTLADEEGGFQAVWTTDGVHPNAAGYAVMAPLAQRAIDEALKMRG